MSAPDLKSFDSASALMDACLDAMESMTEWERAILRTEILKAFGLRAMMAIGTVHLIERQHAQRLREVFGEDSARRVLQQLRSEALRALLDERVLADAEAVDAR